MNDAKADEIRAWLRKALHDLQSAELARQVWNFVLERLPPELRVENGSS